MMALTEYPLLRYRFPPGTPVVVYPEPMFGDNARVVVPESWTALQRSNAICELTYLGRFPLSALALVSVLRTEGNAELAAELLLAGWSPHEHFVISEQR